MSSFDISIDKNSYEVTTKSRFRVIIEVGVVKTNCTVTVCFRIEGESCDFLRGREETKRVCKTPFSISPADGYVEKIYYLTVDCDCNPPDQPYKMLMYVSAATSAGESAETTPPKLTIKCEGQNG